MIATFFKLSMKNNQLLDSGNFTVFNNISFEWKRTSAIGPNWIGISFSNHYHE